MTTPAHPRRASALALVGDGWHRAAGAPLLVLGVWLITLAVTVPFAIGVLQTIEADLGHSESAARAADGVDWGWWQEFRFRHPGAAPGFEPSVIGFGAIVRNLGSFVDLDRAPAIAVTAAVLAGAAWVFLLGGILDRYARQRRIGARGFFGACGVYFWRFLRLAIVAAVLYAAVFALKSWLLTTAHAWLAHDVTVERTGVALRVLLYLPALVCLAAIVVILDVTKARMVIEDRRSVLTALPAALRTIGRNAGATLTVFLLNLAAYTAVVLAYWILAPGAGTATAASVALTLAVGQAYVLARLFVKLATYASWVALVERRVAHAAYTSAPAPAWPDRPAAEIIVNAAPQG